MPTLFYALVVAPVFFPWLALAASLRGRSASARLLAPAYFGLSFAIFAHHNRAYLGGAVPWRRAWLVPLTQLLLPAQMIIALLAPRRIVWRGHLVTIERGGGFRLVRRRA